MAEESGTLPFLIAVDEVDDEDTMGLFIRGEREVILRHIPVEAFRENVRRTVRALRTVFEEVTEETGRLRLREAQFSFEVTAKGGLNLIGTTELGSKGAITLTFRE